jgi:hypothetical protein
MFNESDYEIFADEVEPFLNKGQNYIYNDRNI